jgi:hypothetical protein
MSSLLVISYLYLEAKHAVLTTLNIFSSFHHDNIFGNSVLGVGWGAIEFGKSYRKFIESLETNLGGYKSWTTVKLFKKS